MTPRATTKNNFLPSLFQAAVRSSKPRPPLNMGPPTFIKETVFSSEIHSIEYRDSGAGVMSSPVRRNLIYETEIGGAAEVVFDDIEEIGPEDQAREAKEARRGPEKGKGTREEARRRGPAPGQIQGQFWASWPSLAFPDAIPKIETCRQM